MEFQGLED